MTSSLIRVKARQTSQKLYSGSTTSGLSFILAILSGYWTAGVCFYEFVKKHSRCFLNSYGIVSFCWSLSRSSLFRDAFTACCLTKHSLKGNLLERSNISKRCTILDGTVDYGVDKIKHAACDFVGFHDRVSMADCGEELKLSL